MRTVDLSPLYRSTVGFDRLATMLDQVMTTDGSGASYPPYNIEKTGENSYRISVAVAGFAEDDIEIAVKEGQMTVKATRRDSEGGDNRVYLHRGIAERGFERRFQLAEHVQVKGADLNLGLLHIDLVREVPEALKARTVKIGRSTEQKTIDA
ncbi:MAG: Hsp20 family protein [Pseudomonadota bacterium]